MADLNQIADALKKADAAGDTVGAQKLADYYRSVSAPTPVKQDAKKMAADKNLVSEGIGAGETALSMASGALGSVAGAVVGQGESTLRSASDIFASDEQYKKDQETAFKHGQDVKKAFSYEPQTKEGKDLSTSISSVLKPISDIVEKTATDVQQLTGSKQMAENVRALANMIPGEELLSGLKGVKSAAKEAGQIASKLTIPLKQKLVKDAIVEHAPKDPVQRKTFETNVEGILDKAEKLPVPVKLSRGQISSHALEADRSPELDPQNLEKNSAMDRKTNDILNDESAYIAKAGPAGEKLADFYKTQSTGISENLKHYQNSIENEIRDIQLEKTPVGEKAVRSLYTQLELIKSLQKDAFTRSPTNPNVINGFKAKKFNDLLKEAKDGGINVDRFKDLQDVANATRTGKIPTAASVKKAHQSTPHGIILSLLDRYGAVGIAIGTIAQHSLEGALIGGVAAKTAAAVGSKAVNKARAKNAIKASRPESKGNLDKVYEEADLAEARRDPETRKQEEDLHKEMESPIGTYDGHATDEEQAALVKLEDTVKRINGIEDTQPISPTDTNRIKAVALLNRVANGDFDNLPIKEKAKIDNLTADQKVNLQERARDISKAIQETAAAKKLEDRAATAPPRTYQGQPAKVTPPKEEVKPEALNMSNGPYGSSKLDTTTHIEHSVEGREHTINSPNGFTKAMKRGDSLQVIETETDAAAQGKGEGLLRIKKLFQVGKELGVSTVTSDAKVSKSGAGVWEKLKKQGVDVVKNTESHLEGDDWVSDNGRPIYSARISKPEGPGKAPASKADKTAAQAQPYAHDLYKLRNDERRAGEEGMRALKEKIRRKYEGD